MRKSLLGIMAALFVLSSCSEDVDLTATYKDITVSYGLLDAAQDTHWIRIQKAFLGDDNALLYTVIPDSLYYPATLDAWILAYNSSSAKVDSFHLERMLNAATKDSGVFAAYNNVLYRGVRPLNTNYTYKLFIKKPNGDTTSSSTTLTRKVTMAYPPTASTPLSWEPTNVLVEDKVVNFRWVVDANSYAYQLGLRFNYREWKFGDPGNVTDTSFTYYFPLFVGTSDYQCNSNQICYDVHKPQFYGMIVDNIQKDAPNTPPNEVRLRKFVSLDIIVLQATTEFYNYITINAPSLSYVQKVTAYTNIENGVGIFASRTTSGVQNVTLNTQTLDSLRLGHFTYELNFQP